MADHLAASSSSAWTFPGFYFPTTTPIPDQVFDELLHRLSGAELKVLLYICRRTFGFKKDSDDISLNQMLNGIVKRDGTRIDYGTGLSKPSLIKALKDLQEKGIVLAVRQSSEEKGNEPTNYRLRFVNPSPTTPGEEAGERPSSGGLDRPEKNFTPLGKKTLLGGRSKKFTKPLVKKLNPQQTEIQETEEQQQTAAVVAALMAQGVEPEVAHRLAGLEHVTLEFVRKQIDQRDFLLETAPERVKRPTAFLVRAIERSFAEPDGYRPKALREAEAAAQHQQAEERRRRQAQVEQQVQETQIAQAQSLDHKRQAESERLAQLQAEWGSNERENRLWQEVLADLKSQLNSTIGYGLLERSALLAVEGGDVVLAVPNAWTKDYISQRLSHPLCQALEQHLAGQPVKLQLISLDPAPSVSLAAGVAVGVTADSHSDRQWPGG